MAPRPEGRVQSTSPQASILTVPTYSTFRRTSPSRKRCDPWMSGSFQARGCVIDPENASDGSIRQ